LIDFFHDTSTFLLHKAIITQSRAEYNAGTPPKIAGDTPSKPREKSKHIKQKKSSGYKTRPIDSKNIFYQIIPRKP
jgi:hypothetical protein